MTTDPEAVTRELALTIARQRRSARANDDDRDLAAFILASGVLASLPDDRLAEAEAKVRRVEALCAEAEANPAFCDRHHWPPYVYTSKLRAALSGGDAS